MQLRSIETTPSPNCIKLNLNEFISAKALTLHRGVDQTDAPGFAQQLLAIESVQSVFLVKDFITLTRKGNADWQPILAKAAKIVGVAENADSKLFAQVSQPQVPTATASPTNSQPAFGHVEVAVQMFRGIPVQVRAIAADGQLKRVALPERFNQALQRAIRAKLMCIQVAQSLLPLFFICLCHLITSSPPLSNLVNKFVSSSTDLKSL